MNETVYRPLGSPQPLVSVIIPAYNRQAYISDAIDSVLAQDYPHTELIVVDDGSTDGTVATVERYGDRLTLLQQANRGANAARNAGARASAGDYLVFLDSDDWLSPDALSAHIATAHRWPEAAILCTAARSIGADGTLGPVRVSNWPRVPSAPLKLFMLESPPFPACEMYRREVFDQFGGFDEDSESSDEGETRLRIVLSGHLVVRTEGGYAVYRPVANSVTKNVLPLHRYKVRSLSRLRRDYATVNAYADELLRRRLSALRLRYWNSFLTFHLSLNPAEISKFLYHLVRISKADPGYIRFLVAETPWKASRRSTTGTDAQYSSDTEYLE